MLAECDLHLSHARSGTLDPRASANVGAAGPVE